MGTTFTVGTAISISVETNVQADSGTVTILNPDGTTKILNGVMTDIGSLTWEYIFQSSDIDQTGIYCVIASIVKGVYTSKISMKMKLKIPCGED